MRKPSFRDHLLRQFPADLSDLLVEFNKYIAKLDGDYIMLMARKVLRLYDFLLLAGGPSNPRILLSDHVTEQLPELFEGKTICLVDDTLILGTTLGETKRKLLKAGAHDVTCHVFAIDEDNWSPKLVQPDKVFARLDHNHIRTLCALEVAALSTAGIPYLSDFPFSEPLRVHPIKFDLLHALPGWETHTLTTSHQAQSDVSVYTFLPRRETYDLAKNAFGESVSELLEIIKVRGFCVKKRDAYWTRLVPIVTLRPMVLDNIDALFGVILNALQEQSPRNLDRIAKFLSTPISKLRFVQYVLSLAVGQIFLSDLKETTQVGGKSGFDLTEGIRLFGPWLQSEMQSVHELTPRVFHPTAATRPPLEIPLTHTDVPREVIDISIAEFREFVGTDPVGPHSARTPFTDLIRAFIGLQRKYEPPAREEAHRLGPKIFEMPSADAPYRDRLKFGFVWRALSESLLQNAGLAPNPRRSDLLSLALDYLVDMGIAVPVLCERQGVLFRAYRYGEDVEFGDQELALAYEIAKGYLEGTGRDTIPRIELEKLLASLFRVGISKRFLEVVTTGISGSDGIARLGFSLHGAIPMFVEHDTVFADNQDSWISRYMLERDALVRPEGGTYRLGKQPEAAFPKPGAVNEAHQLGWLLGLLSKSKGNDGVPILSRDNFILLVSCTLPRDAACALAAELRIFSSWFGRRLQRLKSTDIFVSLETANAALHDLTTAMEYHALFSARMKYVGFKDGMPRKIIADCEAFLRTQPHGSFLREHWLGDWLPVLDGDSTEQRDRFEPRIDELGKEAFVLALGLFTLEMALSSFLARNATKQSTRSHFERTCEKVESYLQALAPSFDLDEREASLLTRLLGVVKSRTPMPDTRRAFEFGLDWLNSRIGETHTIVAQLHDQVREFGRTHDRINYAHVFWYDIVDSRGKRANLTGEALKTHRHRVTAFKEGVSQDIFRLIAYARRKNVSLYPWQGPLNSKDDEKHVFIGGHNTLSWLEQVTRVVLRRAQTHGLAIRALVLDAGFAGLAAHKYRTEPGVEPTQFWEHLATLKEELKRIELDSQINARDAAPQTSIIWLADGLSDQLKPAKFVSKNSQYLRQDIETSVDDVKIVTRVHGGTIPPKKT